MTSEISELRVRWQNHRQALLRADYNHADEELARALYFADNTAIIQAVLQDLRSVPAYHQLDPEEWLGRRRPAASLGAGRTNLGFSLDNKERAAQCLRVLDWVAERFSEGKDGLSRVGDTTYGGSSTKFVDFVRSAIETIFDPFYHHVDAELRAQGSLISPADIMGQVQGLVDVMASVRYPETHGLLIDTYRQLYTLTSDSTGSSWFQIGYSCRQILVRFANEVFSSSYVPQGEEQPKGDAAPAKLKWTVRHHLRQAGASDRFRGSVEAIAKANWDFVNSVGHRQESVTEEDARLAVIYTYLTIWLVDRLVTQQA